MKDDKQMTSKPWFWISFLLDLVILHLVLLQKMSYAKLHAQDVF